MIGINREENAFVSSIFLSSIDLLSFGAQSGVASEQVLIMDYQNTTECLSSLATLPNSVENGLVFQFQSRVMLCTNNYSQCYTFTDKSGWEEIEGPTKCCVENVISLEMENHGQYFINSDGSNILLNLRTGIFEDAFKMDIYDSQACYVNGNLGNNDTSGLLF